MYVLITLEILWVGLIAGLLLQSIAAGVITAAATAALLVASRPLRALFGLALSTYWAGVGYRAGLEVEDTALAVGGAALALALALYLHRVLLLSSSPPAGSSARDQQRSGDTSDARELNRPGAEPATDPYSVLGVAPDASPAEITRAYRHRMHEYHPDRVATLGAELRLLAESKAQEINYAYELVSGRR